MLDDKTKSRIIQNAKTYVREVYAHAKFEKDADYDGQTLDSYIAGAEAEAERSSGLEEALEKIANTVDYLRKEAEAGGGKLDGAFAIQISRDPFFLKRIATEALNQYNNPVK